MLFGKIITAAAALVTAVSAAIPLKRGQFYLQTVSKDARFDKLWLYAYHTSAGQNDAILSRNSSYRIPAQLKPNKNLAKFGSNLTFPLGTDFPWGPQFSYQPYASFSPIQINAGDSSTGWSLKKDKTGEKLSYNNKQSELQNGFLGWIVCNWWHPDIDDSNKPAPQLFWRQSYAKGFKIPVNCGAVDLYARRK